MALVLSSILLAAVAVVGVTGEIILRRQRARRIATGESLDPGQEQIRRWYGYRQLYSGVGALILGLALVSPYGRDFGSLAWIFGLLMIVAAVALFIEGRRRIGGR